MTPEQRWEDLIAELAEMASAPWPNEVRVAYLMPRFGRLNLVQPFDWMHWTEPFPETEQAKLLDLETAIKHKSGRMVVTTNYTKNKSLYR